MCLYIFLFVGLLDRMTHCGVWSSSGRIWKVEKGNQWLATVAFDEWPIDACEIQRVLSSENWDPTAGDRGQELVFIGMHMDQHKIR